MKSRLFIEFEGKQTDTKDFADIAKKIWKDEGNLIKDLKDIELYYKPNESKCYYILNATFTGSFEV